MRLEFNTQKEKRRERERERKKKEEERKEERTERAIFSGETIDRLLCVWIRLNHRRAMFVIFIAIV